MERLGKEKDYVEGIPLAFALALALIGGGVYMGVRLQHAHALRTAQKESASWPEPSRTIASALIEKYGAPERDGGGGLVWTRRGAFKRVVARPKPGESLEEVVSYQLSDPALRRVRAFGRGVQADARRSELSARSDQEAVNFLALNLADEVAQGGREPKQARVFYDNTLKLSASGKSSAYMDGLLFEPYRPPPGLWLKTLRP